MFEYYTVPVPRAVASPYREALLPPISPQGTIAAEVLHELWHRGFTRYPDKDAPPDHIGGIGTTWSNMHNLLIGQNTRNFVLPRGIIGDNRGLGVYFFEDYSALIYASRRDPGREVPIIPECQRVTLLPQVFRLADKASPRRPGGAEIALEAVHWKLSVASLALHAGFEEGQRVVASLTNGYPVENAVLRELKTQILDEAAPWAELAEDLPVIRHPGRGQPLVSVAPEGDPAAGRMCIWPDFFPIAHFNKEEKDEMAKHLVRVARLMGHRYQDAIHGGLTLTFHSGVLVRDASGPDRQPRVKIECFWKGANPDSSVVQKLEEDVRALVFGPACPIPAERLYSQEFRSVAWLRKPAKNEIVPTICSQRIEGRVWGGCRATEHEVMAISAALARPAASA